METGLNHLHSTFRWLLLAIMVIAVITYLIGTFQKKPYSKFQHLMRLGAVIVSGLQLVIGFWLYFLKGYHHNFSQLGEVMKLKEARFYTVEHLPLMFLAIMLIHIGSGKIKKAGSDLAKNKKGLIFFGISLILMLVGIPWDRL